MRSYKVLGTDYPVVRKKLPDGTEGQFDAEKGEMQISKKIPSHREWEVESHELFHVAEHVVDIPRRLEKELKLTEDVVEFIREVYAGTVIPVYLDALERNGLLVRPAPAPEVKE